jgi:hypothetical protein
MSCLLSLEDVGVTQRMGQLVSPRMSRDKDIKRSRLEQDAVINGRYKKRGSAESLISNGEFLR